MAGDALPTGGHFVAGAGAIDSAGNTATISQSSQNGIIDWQGFSIGADHKVQFNNGTGATLNRVTGGSLSQIDGNLSATGSVYLINPQGVVVGPGGRIVTNGSFVASTRDIGNDAFMAGGALSASGTSNGDIINAGTITSATGDAILVGRSVTSSGTINAPEGVAAMAAGNQIVLQPVGSDARIAVSGGAGDVTNAGTIKAIQAALAAAGGNVYALVTNGGGIDVTGATTVDGHVWLTTGGDVDASGTITAANEDGSGGKVTMRGGNIDVSGSIDASATKAGHDGGDVSIIAAGTANVSGTLKAKGGAGGKGGTIETSGRTLNVAGATIDGGQGGKWLLDPFDLTVDDSAATTINTTLGVGTDVTLKTTDVGSSGPGTADALGNGDIFVNSALGWSSSATLTLDAYRSVFVNAPITVSGNGGVVLTTNDGGSGGEYRFGLTAAGFTGGIDYGSTDNGGMLAINGENYTLIYSMAGLDAIDGYDAVNGTGTAVSDSGNYALATDLNANGPSTTYINALIGTSNATKFSGLFTGLGHSIVDLVINKAGDNAGLFGYSNGDIRDIGVAGGSVRGNGNTGGLVGYLSGGNIFNAYVTAEINGGNDYAGGLVGQNEGTITETYATGAVTGRGFTSTGGLVGFNNGTINRSFATGSVKGGDRVGGLVGDNLRNVNDSYSTGPVLAGFSTGGLMGFSDGTVRRVYATGAVSAGDQTYGLSNSGSVLQGSWDTQTTGISGGGGGTGLTTAELQGTLPTGFGASVWGTGAGLYPYLKWAFPDGVQAVSGVAYSNSGVTPLATGSTAQSVSALADGSSFGAAYTGANGYYYIALPTGTITDSTAVLASSSGGNAGVRLDTGVDALDGNGNVSGFDIWGNTFIAPTNATNYSTAISTALQTVNAGLIATATGADTAVQTLIAGLSQYGYLTTGDFTFDQSVTLSNGLYVKSAGDITVAEALELSGANGLTLAAARALSFDAPVTVSGAGVLRLVFDNSDTTNLSFGLTSSGFTGGIDYGTSDNGGRLAINDADYTLVYSMDQFDAIDAVSAVDGSVITGYGPGLTGNYALATSLDASGTTYTDALVGTNSSNSNATRFSGTFTGLGHAVSDLVIDKSGSFAGLFGWVLGTLRDIGVVGGSVSSDATRVGALAGISIGPITDAYATSTVNGVQYVGGLAGGSSGPITGAYATGTVSGVSYVGGLLGQNDHGTLDNVYATGAVTGTGILAGGLAGETTGTINNAYASGAVSGGESVGGLAGGNVAGTISNAYATGAVSGDISVGGLFGNAAGTISNVYATGAVSGASEVGGLVGNASGMISNAYASGAVSGTGDRVGGLVGYLAGNPQLISDDPSDPQPDPPSPIELNNAYATGSVTGADNVGGLVGYINDPAAYIVVSNVYATGAVSGSGSNVGGLVGIYNFGTVANFSYTAGSITNGFWDTETTGIGVHDGMGNVSDAAGVTGLTTTAWLTLGPVTTAAFDTITDWVAGYPYPVLKALPHVLVSGTGSQTYGSATPSATVASIVDQDGADATGITDISVLSWISALTATDNVGTSSVIGGAGASADAGYQLTYTGTATVTPASLTVTANDDGKTYDGTAYSGGNDVGYGGFVNGEDSSVLGGALSYGGTAQGAVNAGSYVIAPSGLTAGNYTITFADGALSIDPRGITVTADNLSRIYGLANPALTYAIGGAGLVLGDSLSGALATSATATSSVGDYVISLGTLSGLPNYTITAFTPGQLTITEALLSITANDIVAAHPRDLVFTSSYAGFVNGDDASVVSGLSYGLFPVSGTPLNFNIVPFGASAPGYATTYYSGLLTLGRSAFIFQPALIGDGGYSSFTLRDEFGNTRFRNLRTGTYANDNSVFLFATSLPGLIGPYDEITLDDFSNTGSEAGL